MQHRLNILFWLKHNQASKITGEVPISTRITVDGRRVELSTGKKVVPEKWNSDFSRMKGNSEEARMINRYIDHLRLNLIRIFEKMSEDGQHISAQKIKNIYQGKTSEQQSLIKLFQYHNQQIKEQLGQGYSAGTLERYQTTLKHLVAFVKHQYHCKDYMLCELGYSFITEFEFYLKSVKGIGHNTTMKYLRNFKKIVLLAVKNEWIDRDPFARYKISLKEVKKEILNKEELKILSEKEFLIPRLEQVRDIFLFCCYTGLSYADVYKLKPTDLTTGLDGEQWIFIDRTKTGTSSNVPLLPMALEIVAKYQGHPATQNSGKLLPVYSNQKSNAFLKEIALLCGINKNITFHLARHTFATTVTLANGVPIETVSSMLGHKNIRTTQIYAKVVQEKVSYDMRVLREKLG